MHLLARRVVVIALAALPAIAAVPSYADGPFGPVHVAVNRHEYRGRGCPVEVLFTGTINFVMPHQHGLVMNYFWERSDGAKGPTHVIHVEPHQRSMVVREPWKLGGPGRNYEVSQTLHVNSGNTHLRESSPVVHIECH